MISRSLLRASISPSPTSLRVSASRVVRASPPPTLCRHLASSDRPHTTSDDKKYSRTLLLPRTTLPQRAPAPATLKDRFGARTTSGLYELQRERDGAGEFVFLDGPPYANGQLHMGHSLNKVLKDIINRYQVSRGSRVLYIPGFDCHGLPIENKALKTLKADFHDLAPDKIREAAQALVEESIKSQTADFEDLAVMADWSRSGTYRTLDATYEARQLNIFRTLVERGLVYRRHRPTYYSPSSRTALAESELSYKEDHESRSVFVAFPVTSPSAALQILVEDRAVELCVWTTTPWSLGSNMAIMINEELEYQVLCRTRDSKLLVIATGRREALAEILGEVELVGTLSGKQLLETTYAPVLSGPGASRPLPVISSTHVSPTAGTGLVHCAPAHGAEDYEAYRKLSPSSSLRCPIDDDGRFTSELGADLAGQDILGDGVGAVIDHLRSRGSLISEQKIRHKYPYDWKTKQPVIVRATSQWFANLDDVKPKALKALEAVRFVPPSARKRLQAFVEGRSEWCISRQRTWGVPIPVFHENSTGEPLLDQEVLAHTISVLADKGTSHWWTAPIEEFLPPSQRDNASRYRKGTDTMDVWFDSGSAWTMLPDRGPDRPLAEVVLEGSDQHRGWFQSLLLTCVATAAQDVAPKAPFATVITHGFTLDEKGDKMSKSDGNILSPQTIIHGEAGKDGKMSKAFGTDALRMWVASCDYTGDMSIGPKALEIAAGKLQRFRVLFKFLLGNVDSEVKDVGSFAREDMSLADRFVLNELFHLDQRARASYDNFAFHEVVQSTTNTLNTLSASYFEMARDTVYADDKDLPSRQLILSIFRAVLNVTSQSVAPIVPYLAEELAEHRRDAAQSASSTFAQPWTEPHPSWEDADAKTQMEELLRVKSAVAGLIDQGRAEKTCNVPQKAHLEISVDSSPLADVLLANHVILAPLFSVSHVTLVSTPIDEPQSWEYSCEIPSDASEKAGSKLGIRIFPSSMHKCPRCWVYSSPREEMLCVRCEGVIRDVEEAAP